MIFQTWNGYLERHCEHAPIKRLILLTAIMTMALFWILPETTFAEEYQTFRKKDVEFGLDGLGGLFGQRFGAGGGLHILSSRSPLPLGAIEFRPAYVFLFETDDEPATSLILPNFIFHINWNPFSKFSLYVGGGPNISLPYDVPEKEISIGGQGFAGGELRLGNHARIHLDLGGIGQSIKASGATDKNNGIYATFGLGLVF